MYCPINIRTLCVLWKSTRVRKCHVWCKCTCYICFIYVDYKSISFVKFIIYYTFKWLTAIIDMYFLSYDIHMKKFLVLLYVRKSEALGPYWSTCKVLDHTYVCLLCVFICHLGELFLLLITVITSAGHSEMLTWYLL